jgi:hypothetical protein
VLMSAESSLDMSALRLPQGPELPCSAVGVGDGTLSSVRDEAPLRVKEKFLRGPIPLVWLEQACQLPGRAPLAVALAIWWLRGMRDRFDRLPLTSDSLRRFGVFNRQAKDRGLRALERAGLIRVERRQGKNPMVAILGVSELYVRASRRADVR